MRIISERRIREFWEKHPDSERSMREWIRVVRDADWHNFPDIRKTFNHVDIYKKCVIFDVGGNNYRIIGMVEFEKHIVFIRTVLLHSEYDKNKWKSDCE